MLFAALLNISVLRSVQPMVAKKGLLVLLGKPWGALQYKCTLTTLSQISQVHCVTVSVAKKSLLVLLGEHLRHLQVSPPVAGRHT